MAELTAAGESWATLKVRRVDVPCRVVQIEIWECLLWNWFSFCFCAVLEESLMRSRVDVSVGGYRHREHGKLVECIAVCFPMRL